MLNFFVNLKLTQLIQQSKYTFNNIPGGKISSYVDPGYMIECAASPLRAIKTVNPFTYKVACVVQASRSALRASHGASVDVFRGTARLSDCTALPHLHTIYAL